MPSAEAPLPLDGAWAGTLLAALAVPLAVVLATPLVGLISVAAMVVSPLLFGPILALAVRRDVRPPIPVVPAPMILRRRPFRS